MPTTARAERTSRRAVISGAGDQARDWIFPVGEYWSIGQLAVGSAKYSVRDVHVGESGIGVGDAPSLPLVLAVLNTIHNLSPRDSGTDIRESVLAL
jgi:hypothetical protein